MEQSKADVNLDELYARIKALSTEERQEAEQKARLRVAGKEPVRAEEAPSKYPPGVVRWINRMADAVMLAAFTPSALRIFMAAGSTFYMGIDSGALSALVGFTSILLAEIGQVVFMLAFATATTIAQRFGLLVGAVLCTLYALVGNGHVAQPWVHAADPFMPFVWLETFAPPFIVLIAAHVRKTQVMHSVEARYAAQQQYAADYAAWLKRIEDAASHPAWLRQYTNALRDMLVEVNKFQRKVVRQVTDAEWNALVRRELNADNWYVGTDGHGRRTATVSAGRGRTDEADVSAENGRGHGYGAGYSKRTDARDAVRAHLDANPDDISLPIRALEEKLAGAAKKTTIAEVLSEYRSGNGRTAE